MSSYPNIIIVDDNEIELASLRDSFFGAGIPCLPIQYHNDDPENLSGIDHVAISEDFCPRIVILDLNLTEAQKASPAMLVAPIATVLKKLPLHGPYMLGIWSKLAGEVEEVIELLEVRYKGQFIFPLQWQVISKHDFINTNADGMFALEQKVRELVRGNSLLNAVVSWESRVSDAARRTTNKLFYLAQELTPNGKIEECSLELAQMLAVIGNEALGYQNAGDSPTVALDAGLAPMLSDQLNSPSQEEFDTLWSSALPKLGKRESVDSRIKSRLNTFYHVESVVADSSRDIRGVFVDLDREYIQNSPGKEKFEARIGRKLKSLIHDEFLASSGDKKERERARESMILGFLEISAECDFAQRKVKLPRYILGALIPLEFESLTDFSTGGTSKDTAHSGIYRLPLVSIDGQDYIVKFSFKYQFGMQPEDHKWLSKSRFRIREQVLNAIIFSNSQYVSRPGVVCFL
jgi:hypothetical protein